MGVRRRLAALSLAAATTAAVATPAVATELTWRLAPIPENKATSILRDVAAVDATHAWAVGSEGYHPDQQYTTGDPMILRWNGTDWSRESLPAMQQRATFRFVAASSPTDVWVVGGPMSRTPDDNVTLVWHFDGTTWTDVPYPPGATPSPLSIRDLSVVDGRAWLVGYRNNTPVLHEWTGSSWREHRPPRECVNNGFPNFCTFNAVKAFAADDVWAAGNGMWTGFMGPLLFHWNGVSWRTVDVGAAGQASSFKSLSGLSSKEIWAVGDSMMGGGPIVVRGDGTTWERVAAPNAPLLPAVAVSESGAPWVIGNLPPNPRAAFSTYTAGGWASTPAPVPPDTLGTMFNAITAVPGTDRMIAVGYADLPNTNPKLLRAVIAEYAP